jgi:hypothetical protein
MARADDPARLTVAVVRKWRDPVTGKNVLRRYDAASEPCPAITSSGIGGSGRGPTESWLERRIPPA